MVYIKGIARHPSRTIPEVIVDSLCHVLIWHGNGKCRAVDFFAFSFTDTVPVTIPEHAKREMHIEEKRAFVFVTLRAFAENHFYIVCLTPAGIPNGENAGRYEVKPGGCCDRIAELFNIGFHTITTALDSNSIKSRMQ
jgi:hypothetical protein